MITKDIQIQNVADAPCIINFCLESPERYGHLKVRIMDSIVHALLQGIGLLLALITIVLAWFGSRISRILNEIKQVLEDRDNG